MMNLTQVPVIEDHVLPGDLRCWASGNADLLSRVGDAIVITGARSSTTYGEHVASEFAQALARESVPVMSTLGFGIDCAAITGALMADCPPIVLMPCGLDRVWPHAHADLYRAVVSRGGAALSLEEPGVVPSRTRHVRCQEFLGTRAAGVIVVEAAIRSGARRCGEYALNEGTPVAAVPGPITSALSVGPHGLIASGAQLLDSSEAAARFAREAQ